MVGQDNLANRKEKGQVRKNVPNVVVGKDGELGRPQPHFPRPLGGVEGVVNKLGEGLPVGLQQRQVLVGSVNVPDKRVPRNEVRSVHEERDDEKRHGVLQV